MREKQRLREFFQAFPFLLELSQLTSPFCLIFFVHPLTILIKSSHQTITCTNRQRNCFLFPSQNQVIQSSQAFQRQSQSKAFFSTNSYSSHYISHLMEQWVVFLQLDSTSKSLFLINNTYTELFKSRSSFSPSVLLLHQLTPLSF